jgi:phenylpropionate dioxygenase-like ring-hydroxylating dioxygenase large terminal subunit
MMRSSNGATVPSLRMQPLVDVERSEVSARVLTDPDIYELERQRLWRKSWLMLGHDSEIPNKGDYMSRYMGDDTVLVTRDGKGQIRVLLNSCTHRGMAVCRSEMGHTSAFVCPYHGWTYGLDGQFRGLPVAHQKMQGDLLTKAELGLKQARVATHCGMIFATFDEKAPSLIEWLGDAAWYLTLMFGRSERGVEVLGPPQRWVIEGNWKLAAEQFVGGDSYHVYTLHRSVFEMELIGKTSEITLDSAPAAMGLDISFPQGHSFRCAPTDFSPIFGKERAATMSSREKLLALPPPGMTPQLVEQMFERFDDDQLRVLADMPPTVGGIFPNVGTHNFLWPHPDGGILGAAFGLHSFVPRGPNKVEWWNWQLVEKDAPEELKERISETCNMAVGPSGMLEADDGECWPFMQRAAQGAVAAEGVTGTIKYHVRIGEKRPPNWPGGGLLSEGFTKDDGQWAFWLRYKDFIEGDTW